MVHSTFSPGGMPAGLLEKTFVQRERLAERLTQLFVESALSDSKHHVLLVGPRGIGKSHLVSLIYHRLLNKPELTDKLAIAYLREDEWGVTSFLDLLIRILREFKVPTRELQPLTTEAAEERAWSVLRESVEGKTLLLILENLETVLRSLGEEGQRKWRASIQNCPFWSLLATTPSLSEDVSDHASPFYGFFEIQPLEGLSVPDAVTLMQRLANSQGRHDIAGYVSSPAGRARVRAVQHLANGNHRVFVIFYEFLTRDKEADLVEPVLKIIDYLTPYYQSQMKELSPQQRKLVEFLCRFRSAANVKTIAAACFVSHQTAASQLKQLLESRYLRVTRIGRESYYELNEPLLRICVETKSHTGEPIRLLVEFLRYWFARQELEQKLTAMEANCPERAYFVAALEEYENVAGHAHLSHDVDRLCQALSIADCSRNEAAITAAAQELAQVSLIAEDWRHYARSMSYLGNLQGAQETLENALRKNVNDRQAVIALAEVLDAKGQREEALAQVERVIALDPGSDDGWVEKGDILGKLGRDEEALQAYTHASKLNRRWAAPAYLSSRVLLKLKRYKEARDLLRPVLARGNRHPAFLIAYGVSLARERKFREALRYFKEVTEELPEHLDAWVFQGRTLINLGRFEDAVAPLKRALQIAPQHDDAQFLLCRAFFAVGQYQRSLAELPFEVVAHSTFHEFLELANRGHNKEEIEGTLVRLRSAFATSPGLQALAGGLTEFASHMHRHAEVVEAPQLRRWFAVVCKLFSGDPHFEILTNVFDVMVRYKESHDEKVLLELPLEQRRLLESAGAEAEKAPAAEASR
jgi:tetratricopeptide (TPR) repeat protein